MVNDSINHKGPRALADAETVEFPQLSTTMVGDVVVWVAPVVDGARAAVVVSSDGRGRRRIFARRYRHVTERIIAPLPGAGIGITPAQFARIVAGVQQALSAVDAERRDGAT